MFKNEYQGGAVVDIFSAQGNDPEYDKELRGFVYVLEGSSQKNRMQLPKNSKMALGLSQRFLVLQVFVPMGKDFSAELMVTDAENLKRRLYLSTVHKEVSATPLHAKIPLSCLRLNTWCNVCIDLVSFTGEVFKGAPFQSLDRIIVCASCKLRRIFTMKLQPADTYNESDLYICGNGPREVIPKMCQFPPDVPHVTQLVNMHELRLGEMKLSGSLSSDPEPANSGSSVTARVARNQDVSHIAFGSKVPGLPPLTGKKVIGSGSREMVLGSGTRTGRSYGSLRQNSGDWTEKQSHLQEPGSTSGRDPSPQYHQDCRMAVEGLTGSQWNLQPHPPPSRSTVERPGVRKLRVHSAEKETAPLSDGVKSSGRNKARSAEYCSPRMTADRTGAQNAGATGENPDTDRRSFGSSMKSVSLESSGWTVEPLNLQLSRDSVAQTDVTTTRDGNDMEPQLSLEDIFIFSSLPHSAKHCRGRVSSREGSNSSPEIWGEGAGAHRGARLEDDFLGSESEEDESYSAPVIQRPGKWSSPGVSPVRGLKSRIQSPVVNIQPNADHAYHHQASESPSQPSESNMMLKTDVPPHNCPGANKTEDDHISMVPTRSLSPNRARLADGSGSLRNGKVSPDTNFRVSLSKKSLKEIPIGDSRLHTDRTASGGTGLQPHQASSPKPCLPGGSSHQEEELLMLASLLRQEEDERQEVSKDGTPAGLSASQIHNCNVSISTSSDDTSTWTPNFPKPAYQGHHYQEEMSPLLQSSSRDRLNVLSPPIVPPSEQERCTKSGLHYGSTLTDAEIFNSAGHVEEDFLNLLYDPCLNCYFDPESGKYYELV
ncbi:hypothetical protein GJAV_G00193030 [Gymnothorax javanicus]|nr:hypothetical protein GJAV_G00193030 [Gymnothorax javanicus]